MSTVSSTQGTQNTMSSLARTTSTTTATESEESRFLKLLTTQLQNQDPMNPMENAELTSQLAQMSTVDGIERLNKLFQSLIDAQGTSDSLLAASLVGHSVLVEGNQLTLSGGSSIGGFELDADADQVTLTIKDASGKQVNEITLTDVEAGSHNFGWDGTASDGSVAADGVYTISIAAKQGDTAVTGRALQFGTVTSVIRGASSTDLQVGALGVFKFDDIKQIL